MSPSPKRVCPSRLPTAIAPTVGESEAHNAGKLLKEEGFVFDEAYTSLLKRAIKTLWICLEETDQMWIPVTRTWRLNERHYGALQGLNKQETVDKFGIDQVCPPSSALWPLGHGLETFLRYSSSSCR